MSTIQIAPRTLLGGIRGRQARGRFHRFHNRRYNSNANNLQAYIPELWARESIAVLEENMVAGALVHRDFEQLVASFGETVHTRKPSEFKAYRRTRGTDVTVQDATTANVDVKLDQHIHVTFIIEDQDMSKSFMDLVQIYLRPAILAEARFVDRSVLGTYPQFLPNYGGRLGGLTSTNGKAYILDTRKEMNVNKAYDVGRNLIHNPVSETELLKMSDFTEAQKVGDQGTALREASLGRKLGFDHYMCQNMAAVNFPATSLLRTSTINNAAGYAGGSTVAMTTAAFTGAVSTGEWFILDGQINYVAAHGETLSNTTSITPGYPLKYTVANASPIVVFNKGTLGATYAAGAIGPYIIATATVEIGQFVTISGHATPYVVVDKDDATHVYFDRPLDAAASSGVEFYPGPAGYYSLGFVRNAIALVNRPLALIPNERSAIANNGWMAMRVTITYDPRRQGQLVTIDSLFGTKVLDKNLGALMLG